MDALECLFDRRTAKTLIDPAPSADQLDTILRAATMAPDHKLVRPWRFVVVRGAARTRFGDALGAIAASNPDAPPKARDRLAAKALRAPLYVVVIASPLDDGPVPRWEQLASAAAAVQNICLAATALDVGSGWKSIPWTTHPALTEVFDMREGEEVLGWVELGTAPPDASWRVPPPVPLESVVAELGPEGLSTFPPDDMARTDA